MTTNTLKYGNAYLRNIGLFSEEEQEKLRRAKVVIAGVGGVGGIQAMTLARFGIGELVIFDPGVFDPPDMNRQYGARASTIGRNKALVMAKMLKDANPFLTVQALDYAPADPGELRVLCAGSALVVDAIDYLGFDYKALFARTAREMGLYNLTAPIPDFGALLMIFAPNGMTLEEFYHAPADRSLWPKFPIPLPEIMGTGRQCEALRSFANGQWPYIASNSGAAVLAGSLLATEAALIITGRRPPEEIVVAPDVTYVNLVDRVFEVFKAWE